MFARQDGLPILSVGSVSNAETSSRTSRILVNLRITGGGLDMGRVEDPL